jgi:hypothetical protein
LPGTGAARGWGSLGAGWQVHKGTNSGGVAALCKEIGPMSDRAINLELPQAHTCTWAVAWVRTVAYAGNCVTSGATACVRQSQVIWTTSGTVYVLDWRSASLQVPVVANHTCMAAPLL